MSGQKRIVGISWHMPGKRILFRKQAMKTGLALPFAGQLRGTEEPLNFLVLDRLMEPLSLFEKQRLTDYIIKEYEFIDFNRTVSYYKNYRKMVSAINDNTGAEYDVQEVFEPGTDKSYYRLMRAVDRMEKYRDIRQLLLAPEAERRAIGQQLQIMTRCSRRELEKFLRL